MSREVSPLKKHIQESPKLRALREKRILRRKRIALFFGVLFLLLIGGFIYTAHLTRIQLMNVNVIGNKVLDSDDIVSRVDADLSGSYAYVIPHRNAFLYPKNKILADLQSTFPKIATVTVYRTDFKTLLVTITEVRGRALWCGMDATVPDAPCYFTDDSGEIVSSAPQFSGNVYPRFYGGALANPSAENAPLGQAFAYAKTFGDLIAFQSSIVALGFQVKAISIGPADEDTLTLDLGGGKTALVRFLKDDDLPTITGNLAAALGNSDLANSMKTDKANLEYFDLRFTNKVYYKFSDEQ